MAAKNWRAIAVAGTLAVGAAVGGGAQQASDGPAALARAGFSRNEIASIERGSAVARVLDTDNREIAVLGAVKILAPVDALAERFRTIDYLKSSNAVQDAGTFGRPPSVADLQRLPIEPYDLDVRDCRVGDCRVRLSAEDVARFHREVKWDASNWMDQSAAVWREVLTAYAAGYTTKGAAALPVFVNKEQPLSVQDERQILLRQLDLLKTYAPALDAYLQDPVRARPASLEELTYWTKEDFGVRPVMRIVHQVMHRAPGGTTRLAIASSQIYAAHYLDASIGVTLGIDASADGSPAFYMVSINRARTRSLTGVLRAMVRSTVRGRSREAMERILVATKRSLEPRTPR